MLLTADLVDPLLLARLLDVLLARRLASLLTVLLKRLLARLLFVLLGRLQLAYWLCYCLDY